MSRLVDIIDGINEHVDLKWQELLDENRRRPIDKGEDVIQIACREGCAACCTYVVSSTTPECARLAGHVESMPEPQRGETIARLFAWVEAWERFAKRNPPPSILRPGDDHDEVLRAWTRVSTRWQVRRAACPFLETETNRCSIYAIRPVSCRTHHATMPPPDSLGIIAAPPEVCFTRPEDAERGSPRPVYQLNPEFGELMAGATFHVFKKAGINFQPAVLPVGVLGYGERSYGWKRDERADDQVPVVEHARLPSWSS